MIFKDFWFLFLFLLLPIPVLFKKRLHPASIRFSYLHDLKKINKPFSLRLRKLVLGGLRLLSMAGFIFALSRPQSISAEREYETEGIDIVVSMDISGSMQAMDFQPVNRLEVAKEEAVKFIRGRKHDRIGLVIFARQSFTQCPLTLDYEVLTKLVTEIQPGQIKDGTAIGLGLATAINRLRESSAKSKVIVLLTDGANNAGNIDPITAAELAKKFKIKVYTIGIGKDGLVPFPVDDPLFGRRYVQAQVEMDEPTMQKIATMTGGLYFRARDQKSLEQIYQTIDKLEKSKVNVKEFSTYEELFPYFLIPALLCLFFAILMENTLFLKVP